MPRFARSGYFWSGVVVGAVVGPYVMKRIKPRMQTNIPPQ